MTVQASQNGAVRLVSQVAAERLFIEEGIQLEIAAICAVERIIAGVVFKQQSQPRSDNLGAGVESESPVVVSSGASKDNLKSAAPTAPVKRHR